VFRCGGLCEPPLSFGSCPEGARPLNEGESTRYRYENIERLISLQRFYLVRKSCNLFSPSLRGRCRNDRGGLSVALTLPLQLRQIPNRPTIRRSRQRRIRLQRLRDITLAA